MLAPSARAATTDMRHDSRRQAIVTAAAALLFEDNNPTARSIAARAGLSLKYIYESFDSVDEILVVAYEEALHGLRRTITAAPNTIEGTSRAVVTSQYDFHRDHPEQARMLSTRAYAHPKLALCRLHQFERVSRTSPKSSRGSASPTPCSSRVSSLARSARAFRPTSTIS